MFAYLFHKGRCTTPYKKSEFFVYMVYYIVLSCAMPQRTTTRHGKRADGIVVVSIPMSGALKEQLATLAASDGRKTAAFVRHKLQELVRRSQAARKAA